MLNTSTYTSRERGFSLVELIVVVAIIGILASIVIPALISAVDRSRQRRSMADMNILAKANATYSIDYTKFVNALTDLQPAYIQVAPVNDGWGNPFQYTVGAGNLTYTLTSLGSDGAAGPPAPTPWINNPFEPDIIMNTGQFTQMPVAQ
ncbi:MAG: prepilin-type N-terminal cleavage/methylation domain-containing protein [Acidobacteriota bacterium]